MKLSMRGALDDAAAYAGGMLILIGVMLFLSLIEARWIAIAAGVGAVGMWAGALWSLLKAVVIYLEDRQ